MFLDLILCLFVAVMLFVVAILPRSTTWELKNDRQSVRISNL